MYNVHLCKVWKIDLLRSGILRDKTMDDKLIYIINDVKNIPINLLVEKFESANQVPKVFK